MTWSGHILPQIEQATLYETLVFQESGPGNWAYNGDSTINVSVASDTEVFDFALKSDDSAL